MHICMLIKFLFLFSSPFTVRTNAKNPEIVLTMKDPVQSEHHVDMVTRQFGSKLTYSVVTPVQDNQFEQFVQNAVPACMPYNGQPASLDSRLKPLASAMRACCRLLSNHAYDYFIFERLDVVGEIDGNSMRAVHIVVDADRQVYDSKKNKYVAICNHSDFERLCWNAFLYGPDLFSCTRIKTKSQFYSLMNELSTKTDNLDVSMTLNWAFHGWTHTDPEFSSSDSASDDEV